jgi:hypothetical protein
LGFVGRLEWIMRRHINVGPICRSAFSAQAGRLCPLPEFKIPPPLSEINGFSTGFINRLLPDG